MRRVSSGIFFAIFILCAANASAGPYLQIICADCRGPAFQRDYGNFAFNQVFGENAWVSPELGSELIIYNLQGHSVFVDMNFILSNYTSLNLIDLFEIQFGWPTGDIRIATQTTAAATDSYDVDLAASLQMGGLSVGWGSGSGSSGTGTGSGSSGGVLACTSAGNNEWVCVEVHDN